MDEKNIDFQWITTRERSPQLFGNPKSDETDGEQQELPNLQFARLKIFGRLNGEANSEAVDDTR